VTPDKIPVELQPHWGKCFPGLFRKELDAFLIAGITPKLDLSYLKAGRLALSFDWPLDDKVTLRLEAFYPDSFPRMRPQVKYIIGLDNPPSRHCSPIDGNLCLLGRDSRQWLPSLTLHKLLSEQLKNTIYGTGDEDPQGEPAEFWWNFLGPIKGTYCLIDSSWDLDGIAQGSFQLSYSAEAKEICINNKKHTVPFLRGVVTKICDRQNNSIHNWEGSLPITFAQTEDCLDIPWVYIPENILPEPQWKKQINKILEEYPHLHLKKLRKFAVGNSLKAALFAIAYPNEIGYGKKGVSWIFFMHFGRSADFKNNNTTLIILPTFRAGKGDIGYRVPTVKLLRNKRILVVGAGAVGAPVAIELARNNCGHLNLIEHDVVEPGNTVRWPLGASAWGKQKLTALEDFLSKEYPATKLTVYNHYLGLTGTDNLENLGDNAILDKLLLEVDLVIDASASYGVTSLLDAQCRQANVPLISVFATPTLKGGAVVLHYGDGGCPTCLEHAWCGGTILPPPGRNDSEHDLIQPPGCAERTFSGASYDLQELSLQTVRLAVETLSKEEADPSLVQTLSFVDEKGAPCPPSWRIDILPKHPDCSCG
jgi:hypothetical protein